MKTKKLPGVIFVMLFFVAFTYCSTAQTNYYFKGTGNYTLPSQWGTNQDGTGVAPPRGPNALPVQANVIWNVANTARTVSIPMTGNWQLGAGSKIVIGAGAVCGTCMSGTLTIQSNLSVLGSGVVDVNNNGVLINSNTTTAGFSVGALTNNSLVKYTGNVAQVAGGVNPYGNLTITGASAKLTANVTVANAFTAITTNLNGFQLTLNGAATMTGSVTGNSGILDIEGAGVNLTLTMDQSSAGVSNALGGLTYNSAGGTLTIGNALNMTSTSIVQPNAGTINANGNMTLLADQVTVGNTASISQVTGVLNGNITSQVFHNPTGNTTDWRLMGSPGINSPASIYTSWVSAFPITCPNCASLSGCCTGGNSFTSIYYYNETFNGGVDYNNANHYVGLATATDALNPGEGVWVWEGNTSPQTSTPGELISVSGSAFTGPLNYGVTLTAGSGGAAMNGFNLVGNPYPCPISWSVLQPLCTNISTTYYVWSPTLGGGNYSSDDVVTGPSADGLIGDFIPTGGGFFVQATAAAGTVAFAESTKSPGSSQVLLRQSQPRNSQISLNRFNLMTYGSGINQYHGTSFIFSPLASTAFGKYDVPFLPGTGGANSIQVSSVLNGFAYMKNAVSDLNQNYSIPVRIQVGTTGTYTVNATALQYMPSGICLILHDNYTNTDLDLRQGPFSITLTDTEKVARFMLNVTATPLQLTTNVKPETCPNANDGKVTVVGNNAGPWNYVWKDVSNNVIRTSLNKASADTLYGLSNQVVSVDVNTVGSCDHTTQSFTLTAPGQPVSTFTSATTVNVNSNVVFSNTSSNANSYWWTFGDGNTSNLQNPSYAYNMPGTYTVTLYAINSLCGDTVTSRQTITVQATTGIASVNNQEFVISKDQNGAFIKFNYSAQTRVNINVYNTLGQTILANGNLLVSGDKIYINTDNSKDQMIFITISNLDNNTQLTKKMFNN